VIAKQFEQAYPKIRVLVRKVGVDQEREELESLKSDSVAPDVAEIEYHFLPFFIDAGKLIDISKFGANEAKPYFVPWTWDQVSPDGMAVFGIPQSSGAFSLIYNRKMFNQYGLAIPTTWEEYAQQAEKLAKASNGQVKMGHFYTTSATWLIGLVWASGGELFKKEGDTWIQTLNNSIAERVLTYWVDLVKKGYVSTIPWNEYYTALRSGQIASSIAAAWDLVLTASSLNDKPAGEWRASPLPQWTKDTVFRSGNWGGSCDAVTIQSKHPNAATLFAVWLNAAKGPVLAKWTTGVFPVSLSGLEAPDLNQPDKNPAKFFDDQNLLQVYSDATKAVSVRFAWPPWLDFVNENFKKQAEGLFTRIHSVGRNRMILSWQMAG
jgi:multiple sugar transport system substrate-binding protein